MTMPRRTATWISVVGVGALCAVFGVRTLRAPGAASPKPVRTAGPGHHDVGATANLAPQGGTLAASADTDGFLPAEIKQMQAIVAKFSVGDFAGALDLADERALEAGASPGFHRWIIAQLPVLLTSAGWSKLRLGACDEATQYLRRAEALGRTLETAKGLAVCFYKQKNFGGAKDQFAWFLERQPDDLEMGLLYADVMESEGRYDEAVKLLERADAVNAGHGQDANGLDPTALKQRLSSMRAREKEGVLQQVETSQNFRLSYRSVDHEDLVNFVLTTLEDALDEYIETYGMQAPRAPIEVVLYPAADFKSAVAYGPEWAEGLFDGRLRIPIRDEMMVVGQDNPFLREVLRHELVHALFAMASDSRNLPSWFNEGIAQRLSCASPGCGPFQFPPTPGLFLAKEAFFTPYTSFDALRAGRAYRQSLYLIYAIETLYGAGISNAPRGRNAALAADTPQEALRRLVTAVTTTSDLGSDSLVAPLGATFDELHAQAASLWNRRIALNSQGTR